MPKNKNKKRLDVLLVEKKLFESRQKAQAAIMAGNVNVEGKVELKAGTQVLSEADIEIKAETCPYVSRGGFKLEKALKEFNINVEKQVCIDAGASSGGFTDCLLQHGAAFVYAIDVGYGQIDWKLRNDNRVEVLERTNIRHLKPEELYKKPDSLKATFCTVDLSFISVTKVLENIVKLMNSPVEIIVLIKPQFEAGKDQVPKTGVVKDKSIHIDVINTIFDFCSNSGLIMSQLTYSPIKGPSGNIEYLCYITDDDCKKPIDKVYINDIVNSAHQELNQ